MLILTSWAELRRRIAALEHFIHSTDAGSLVDAIGQVIGRSACAPRPAIRSLHNAIADHLPLLPKSLPPGDPDREGVVTRDMSRPSTSRPRHEQASRMQGIATRSRPA
jgi:hypothetical protein